MSGVMRTARHYTSDIAGWVGLKGTYNDWIKRSGLDRATGTAPAPVPGLPPTAPTFDTAANAANQQQDQMRRRRGVLMNIYAGSQAPAPTVASKQLLGS